MSPSDEPSAISPESSSDRALDDREAEWTAPGPGTWTSDRSHGAPGPTPVFRRIASAYTADIYREVFQRFGSAAGTLDIQFVNGHMYRRLVPLIAPDRDQGTVPPNPVLWLVSRLHPELRRRTRTAAQVMEAKTFLDDINHWNETERFEWIEANQALQAVDLDALDDQGLADHLGDLDRQMVDGWHRHHRLHANDLGPIGDLLVHGEDWGMDPVDVMLLLQGSSPATVEAADHAAAIARALSEAGVDPATITDRAAIEAVPAAREALERYLSLFGWRLVSDYDISGLTLHELPEAVVTIVVRAAERAAERADGERDGAIDQAAAARDERYADLRAQADDPALFDTLVDDARRAYGVRDDNGPLTWSWPSGLTRRAYLEAGRRLAAAGVIDDPAHAFETDIPELRALLTGEATDSGSAGIDGAELARRARVRAWESTLDAPDVLGPPPAQPDVSPLPDPLRRLMRVTLAAVMMVDPDREVDGGPQPLQGLGIGSETYRGRARVVTDAAQAIAALEPGDILVSPYTAPSFNAVFTIAGGVVVQEGGLLCHAAVMARELAIPAVVGCHEAMTRITDGDQVEINPADGTVRIVVPA